EFFYVSLRLRVLASLTRFPYTTLFRSPSDVVERRADPGEGPTAGTEEAEQSVLRHPHHQVGGGDALVHGSGHVGVPGAVDLPEPGGAEHGAGSGGQPPSAVLSGGIRPRGHGSIARVGGLDVTPRVC